MKPGHTSPRALRVIVVCMLITAAILLAGCATTERQVIVRVPVEVQVPVRVACMQAADKPTPPTLTSNADALAMTDRALVLLIAEERETLAAYALKADAVLTGCSTAQ
jgi:hypothetical protein